MLNFFKSFHAWNSSSSDFSIEFLNAKNCDWRISHAMPNGTDTGENLDKSDVNKNESVVLGY